MQVKRYCAACMSVSFAVAAAQQLDASDLNHRLKTHAAYS
jgi:hypothetical protein